MTPYSRKRRKPVAGADVEAESDNESAEETTGPRSEGEGPRQRSKAREPATASSRENCENEEADSSSGGSDAESSSSASHEEEGSSEEDSSEYEIVAPPQSRSLPERVTRGRRFKELIGSDAEVDEEFWGNDVWNEEAQDEEWSTENEGHYKDKFDSDFLDTESSDDEADETGALQDAELKKLDKGKKKLKFDYHKIARQNERRREQSTKIWSVFNLEEPPAPKGKKTAKPITQELLMQQAEQTKILSRQNVLDITNDLEMQKQRALRAMDTQVITETK